jgi:hypothetical protein
MAGTEEITLYDSQGNAVVYIADDESTISTWSGKPVAYLDDGSDNEPNVYGFNGKHLGWFLKGIVRGHDGNAVVGVKPPGFSKFKPFKGFKQFKPFKAFKQFAPFRPFLTNNWSSIPWEEFWLDGGN